MHQCEGGIIIAKVKIIATGGTISGFSDNRLDLKDYRSGGLTIEKIIERIPEIHQYAQIELEQLSNFSSCEITFEHWSALQHKVETALNEQGFDAVVITHGTNTIEETAYFLHLTVNSKKPIVLVGAQRPLSAIGTDAAINLLNAVRVAASPDAYHKGVMVVLNDEINCAREVTKTNTYRLETFQSGQFGILGYVDVDGTVQFYRAPVRKHTVESCFAAVPVKDVPEVAIVYSYAGATGDLIRMITQSKRYGGIVIAGTGAGKFSKSEEKALVEAVESGISVVRSSRVGNGRVVELEDYKNLHFICGDNLLPQKARILLMLSLVTHKSYEQVQQTFYEY